MKKTVKKQTEENLTKRL